MKFDCPRCESVIRTAAGPGRSTRCPGCRVVVRVPSGTPRGREVACPGCGERNQTFQTPGNTTRCKGCAGTFSIPGALIRAAPTSGDSNTNLFIGIGFGFLGVVLFVIGVGSGLANGSMIFPPALALIAMFALGRWFLSASS